MQQQFSDMGQIKEGFWKKERWGEWQDWPGSAWGTIWIAAQRKGVQRDHAEVKDTDCAQDSQGS
jgi:hypothetical protein